MATLNLKIGDVVIVNAIEWTVISIYADTLLGGDVYWGRSNETPPNFRTVTPSQYGALTKKEPIFIVGHIYQNEKDPVPKPTYTVALIDGLNVLVWWADNGNRFASWVPYDQRKNFVDVTPV